MSYGAKIYNSSGQIILDDEETTYLLSLSFTQSGVFIGDGLYEYAFSSMPEVVFPTFVNLNVGNFFGPGSNGYVSTQSSLTFFNIKPANEIPDPTGYDVVFYNSSGQKTWIASSSTVVLNSFSTLAVSGSFASDADHIALLSRLPYFIQVGPTTGIVYSQGIFRTSSSLYSWEARPIGLGPAQNVGPFQVSCLFAKSN
jgi:hypothetical protein